MAVPKKVLVVDDSETDRHKIADELRKNGFSTLLAANGEEAIEICKNNLPDVVIMDVVMPGIGGFAATRKIKDDPATGHIPVIICTTKSMETDKVWAKRQGATDYFIKPINFKLLVKKISELVGI